MAEGFRLAGAYVEVRLEDNTAADEARIRARLEKSGPVDFESALKDPNNVAIVKKRVESGPAAKINADLDDKLAKAKADEFVAKRRKAVVDLDMDIDKVQAKLAELNKKRGTSVQVDADIRKAEAELAALVARRRTAKIEVEVGSDSTRRAESEMSRLAARANAIFDAKTFAGLSVGLPAAAAVSAAAVVASLSAVPAVFAGIAAAALSGNATIQASFTGLVSHVVTDVQTMAAPLQGYLTNAIDDVGASFNRLRPQIQAAIQGSGPAIRELTGAVTDFAESAMPGMVTAIQASQPALQGLRAASGQVGAGVSDMFTNMSRGAVSAGQSMQIVGEITRDFLGFVGTLTANLSAATGPLNSLRGGLQQAEGALTALTAAGSGSIGFLSGFTNAGMGALGVVNILAHGIAALPPQVTQFAGSLTAAGAILSRFGVDVGAGFDGLGARVKSATTAGEKFGTAIGGLIGGALNPASLAVAGLGLLLQVLGQNQANAAAKAAEHRKELDALSDAIRRDGNAIGQATRDTVAKTLADHNAYVNAQKLSVGIGTVNEAALGSSVAMQSVTQSAKDYATSILSGNQANRNMLPTVLATIDSFDAQKDSAADLVKLWDGPYLKSFSNVSEAQKLALINYLDLVGATRQANKETAEQVKRAQELEAAQTHLSSIMARDMSPSMYGAVAGSNALKAAFEKLNAVGGDVVEKGKAIIDVMQQLRGVPQSAEEALQAFNDHIRGIGDAFKDAKGKMATFPKDMIDAAGAINTASKSGSDLQNVVKQGATDMTAYGQALKDAGAPASEIEGKLGGLRTQLEGQLKALGLTPAQIQKVLDHYGLIPSSIMTMLGLEGDKETQAKITDIKRQIDGLADKSVGVKVDALTGEAQAALLQLGYSIVRLPDGTFRVFANTAEGKAAADKLASDVGNTKVVMPVKVEANVKGAADAIQTLLTNTAATKGSVVIGANTDPATGDINVAVQYANGSKGIMTVDGNTNPVTGKTMVAVEFANGQHTYMTIDAFNEAAKNKTLEAKRNADGTIGWIIVNANASGANASIDNAARTRYATIVVTTVSSGSTYRVGTTGVKFSKDGGLIQGYAEGGSVYGFPWGGPVKGPGGPRSDMVPAMLSNGEYVINAKQTAANLALLEAINSGRDLQRPTARTRVTQPPRLAAPAARVPDDWPQMVARAVSAALSQAVPSQRGVVVNQTIHPAPGMDERSLAAATSREFAWSMRGA